MDFTALVMSRIETEPTVVQPSTDASTRERAQAVAGTLAFAALLVLASGAALIRFEPELAFAALSAVVSGCVMLLLAVRTVSDSLYAASSNNGLMLVVSGLLFVSLVFWSQIARSSDRVTREA
jgi:multisubunit Na+/H+ antiporter MnhB subunit